MLCGCVCSEIMLRQEAVRDLTEGCVDVADRLRAILKHLPDLELKLTAAFLNKVGKQYCIVNYFMVFKPYKFNNF